MAEGERREPRRSDAAPGVRGRIASRRPERSAPDPGAGRHRCEVPLGDRCRHSLWNAGGRRWSDPGAKRWLTPHHDAARSPTARPAESGWARLPDRVPNTDAKQVCPAPPVLLDPVAALPQCACQVSRQRAAVALDRRHGPLIHLLTTSTLDELRRLYLEGRFEARRFRPNIIVNTNQAGFVESGWVGKTVAIGDEVKLKITDHCTR